MRASSSGGMRFPLSAIFSQIVSSRFGLRAVLARGARFGAASLRADTRRFTGFCILMALQYTALWLLLRPQKGRAAPDGAAPPTSNIEHPTSGPKASHLPVLALDRALFRLAFALLRCAVDARLARGRTLRAVHRLADALHRLRQRL